MLLHSHNSDLIGRRFGRLQVVSVHRLRNGARTRIHAVVRCDCGTEKQMCADALISNRTKSCGCLRRELVSQSNRTHGCSGKRKTKEYSAWRSMIARCHIESATGYEYYGGRGISVCDRWRNDFSTFVSDMGESPSAAHSIDRIDVNGNYEPANCRWANASLQQHNKRKRSGTTSKYVGVSWSKRTKKWVATIKDGNVCRHLGYFDDEREAHLAYEARAKAIYGM